MNTNEHTTVIEVNGVKLEVDLRTARRIDNLKVGSRVKVLRKSDYGDHKVFPGIVVGFDPFPSLPTMTIAFLDINYSEAKLEFVAFNGASKGIEIVASIDNDELEVDKGAVLARIDREIEKHGREIEDLRRKREWFLHNFKVYFADLAVPESA